jgi:hypothetical protein
MADRNNFEKHMKTKLPYLTGSKWVSKNSGYERCFAEIIGAKLNRGSFWDCTWPKDAEDGLRIEVKKCKDHAWLNLLTYADPDLKSFNGQNMPVTLFLFHKDNTKISSLSIMTMGRLLALLRIKEVAGGLNDLKGHYRGDPKGHRKGRLNVQYRLTRKEIRRNSEFNEPPYLPNEK